MYIYQIFFIQSSVDGHLDCFHVLAIINNAAMNIGVHVSFQISVFAFVLFCFGYKPGSEIAKSYVLNFVKCFFCTLSWDDHIIFILHFVNVVYNTDLWILNHPCIPGINHTGSWCVTLLMYCWIWFANILLSFFTSMFIRDIGLQFSFLVVSSLVLVSG